MSKLKPAARLSQKTHSGLITFRPCEGRELGTLLLNISETETRIRFLPGFLSATFLTGADGISAEIVQWQTGQDLGNAFGMPAFSEHLPLAESFAPHPGLAFANPSEILMADGGDELELSAPKYAIALFKTDPDDLARVHIQVGEWVGALIGDTVAGAAIHVDKRQSHLGVLLLGRFAEAPPAPAHLTAYLLEEMGPLRLYASITPPPANAKPITYHMTMLPAGQSLA